MHCHRLEISVVRRFLIIAGFADSLVLFRGALIKAMVASGLEVHAAAPEITTSPLTRAALERMGVQVHDIPAQRAGTNPLMDILLFWRLFWLMCRVRPNVVLGYTIKPVIYGTIAAWFVRVPQRFALITGLGYAFTNGRAGALQKLIRRMYTFALTRAEKVFFQNPDDLALFRQFGIVPSSVGAVVVNGSGVDLQRFNQAPLAVGGIKFLMICRLLGDKGVREYVSAAQRIRAIFPDAHFALAGWIDENPDSIKHAELESWIADEAIEFLGKLDDVRPAIADCTVYVLPSYREGTPKTVLEAMSMGRPIITTDAPGCRETVVDGRNGFLIPAKSVDALVDAMQKFIVDPVLASKMGQESRKIAESKYDVHVVNEVMMREMKLLFPTNFEGGTHG